MQNSSDKKNVHDDIVENETPQQNEQQEEIDINNGQNKEILLQQQINHFRDQFLRANADFQNFKRRTEKEKTEWISMAQISALAPLVEFFENFDRAIELSEKNQTPETVAILEGFKLIQKNLKKTLTDLGVTEISCTGQFNPELQEALVQTESDQHKSGEIVSVLGKGYMFKDKVIRHAKVCVAK
jgi:molecular chaperone GrpE